MFFHKQTRQSEKGTTPGGKTKAILGDIMNRKPAGGPFDRAHRDYGLWLRLTDWATGPRKNGYNWIKISLVITNNNTGFVSIREGGRK
jgi:hypothetical protein